MRLTWFIIICLCISCQNLFAQTSGAVVSNLSKLFQKLEKYDLYNKDDLIDTINDQLDDKLSFYIKTAPGALSEAFPTLGAVSSPDSAFSILSWDTQLGGTQHAFANLYLFKANGRINYVDDSLVDSNDYPYYYEKIFSLKSGEKTYYLATYTGILDLKERMDGIRVFSVENGKLNYKVKLIKTGKGFTHKLSYRYIFEMDDTDSITYDPKSKEITFPVINKNERPTGNLITYRFNGKYFERVKN